MRVLPILLAAAPFLSAQEAVLLPRIRERMTDVLLRQPNYTCTETIERTRQEVGNRARVEDTLRLEVALVDGKEMFAWPGSKQFEDHDLRELVSTGMFGNGNFAIYARVLFLNEVATVESRGETQFGGRTVRQYDYHVARSVSGERLRVNNAEAIVGFHGSFYADPVTLDVLRIEVVAEDIPADLGLSASEVTVDYGRLEIGDQRYLLPVESTVMMATPNAVDRNWVRFASCRRFAGQSTLLFDDPILTETSAPVVPKVGPTEVTIPTGLTLQLEIPQLDLTQGAVGDPVRALMVADLRDGRRLLAPKGSVARGRIVRLDRYASHFALKIEFQELEWPAGHAPLKLSFDRTPLPSKLILGGQTGGEILISRQAGRRLSGILMFWRTEP